MVIPSNVPQAARLVSSIYLYKKLIIIIKLRRIISSNLEAKARKWERHFTVLDQIVSKIQLLKCLDWEIPKKDLAYN